MRRRNIQHNGMQQNDGVPNDAKQNAIHHKEIKKLLRRTSFSRMPFR